MLGEATPHSPKHPITSRDEKQPAVLGCPAGYSSSSIPNSTVDYSHVPSSCPANLLTLPYQGHRMAFWYSYKDCWFHVNKCTPPAWSHETWVRLYNTVFKDLNPLRRMHEWASGHAHACIHTIASFTSFILCLIVNKTGRFLKK